MQGGSNVLITKNSFDIIWSMIFREPPGILQEVGIPINKIISGCNADKKLIFFKKKLQPSP